MERWKSNVQYVTAILCLYALPAWAQKKQCACDKDESMNQSFVSCETKTLSNGTKLYWQFNCDRIWFTFKNTKGQTVVLDEIPVELFGYTYRLGFHLIKEFDRKILFRSGCPANGSCVYTLIDKDTGKKLKIFNQLICIDTDIDRDGDHVYNFDFLVYFSNTPDQLVIYYLNSGKVLNIPFKERLTGAVPEYQFEEMTLAGNILTLAYESDAGVKKTLKIDVQDRKYVR